MHQYNQFDKQHKEIKTSYEKKIRDLSKKRHDNEKKEKEMANIHKGIHPKKNVKAEAPVANFVEFEIGENDGRYTDF